MSIKMSIKNPKNVNIILRANKEWKNEVVQLCKFNNIGLSKFIRESVEANLENLTRPIMVDDAGCDVATGKFLG